MLVDLGGSRIAARSRPGDGERLEPWHPAGQARVRTQARGVAAERSFAVVAIDRAGAPQNTPTVSRRAFDAVTAVTASNASSSNGNT